MIAGVSNYKEAYVQEDVEFCRVHASSKPPSVPKGFLELSNILFEENNWDRPGDTFSALELYMNLCIVESA